MLISPWAYLSDSALTWELIMKITQSDFNTLKSYIQPVLDGNPTIVQRYEHGMFARSDKVKDLQQRLCFDVLHASRVKIGDGIGIHGDIDLYAYLDDSHIYTALKAMCPKVERKY